MARSSPEHRRVVVQSVADDDHSEGVCPLVRPIDQPLPREHVGAMPGSSAVPLPGAETPWALSSVEVLAHFNTSESGLAADEAARRIETFRRNELEPAVGPSLAGLIVGQFRSPLIYILIVAAVVSIALEQWNDAGVISAVLLINAVVGSVQEYRAERSLRALQQLTQIRSRVLRDGEELQLDAAELVPGDVVLFASGARVPADCRLLQEAGLQTDESVLTGESTPVAKAELVLVTDTALADRRNMLFAGTSVISGRARAVVTFTAAATEIGRIAEAVREIGVTTTPLQRRMARLARLVAAAALVVVVVSFAIGVVLGEEPDTLFLTLVALIVSAVPEGLPIVLTITLAVAVRRMVRRQVVIRQLPAVETLGSCTVIGSDKTGTLTQNRMTVQVIYTGRHEYTLSGSGHDLEGTFERDGRGVHPSEDAALLRTLTAAALCNDAHIAIESRELVVEGDPTEIALLVSAAKAGINRADLDGRYPRWGEIPFESARRYAATFHRDRDHSVVFVKGAPETIVALCSDEEGFDTFDRAAALAAASALASTGRRVLAMASGVIARSPGASDTLPATLSGLTFLGLQAMIDPPRPEVAQAIDSCRSAGIRILMITGDHPQTAVAISEQLQIAPSGAPMLDGAALNAMSDDELSDAVQDVSVYARVAPDHKLRIVRALQSHGHVVAVTGDGVNDAPALKGADIGVAMGLSGTDVAREAAAMVITDDNFASIVAGVEEGRNAFANVRNATFYLISSGVGEIIAIMASIFFRFDLPMGAAQLLWLNLVTNSVEDLGIALEPGDPRRLRQPPRPHLEGVLSRVLWERLALVGGWMAGGTVLLFLIEINSGASLREAQSVALTTMVLFQAFHAGNARSEDRSLLSMNPLANPFLLVGTLAAVSLHIGALYFGPTQEVLRLEPIGMLAWGKILATSITILIVVELHKWIRRRSARRS